MRKRIGFLSLEPRISISSNIICFFRGSRGCSGQQPMASLRTRHDSATRAGESCVIGRRNDSLERVWMVGYPLNRQHPVSITC